MASRQQLDNQITLLTRRLNEALSFIATIDKIFKEPPYGYTSAGEKVFQYEDKEIGFQDLQGDLVSLNAEVAQLQSQIADLRNQYTQASADITFNTGLAPAQTVLRDYRHAARIFVDDQYRLSPKYGFLFYVEFDFNPLITNISDQTLQYKGLGQGNVPARELGMLVKSATLPKFTIETKTHNAYNRKNIVQNSIK
jgi:hypothetical protein